VYYSGFGFHFSYHNYSAVQGNVEAKEMLKTFNCGIGMVVVVSKENKSAVLDLLAGADVNARHIGHLVDHLEGE